MKTIIKALLLLASVTLSGSAFASYCDHDQWYSHKYGRCFDKYGKCWQYNDTDKHTCNSPKDKLSCEWDHYQETCRPEHKTKCGHDEWYSSKYKKCYKKRGHCGQYNYTDSQTCNSGHDHMQCEWDRYDRVCYRDY